MTREQLGRLDSILAILNHWVDDHLGREVAKLSGSLLWLRGTTDARGNVPRVDVVVLLSDSWQKPKMQYLSICTPASWPGDGGFFDMPEFPCLVEITVEAHRLSERFAQVFMMTSDEFASELADMPYQWEARPLTYTMEGTTTLMQMRLLGAGEPLRNRSPKAPRVHLELDEVILLGDLVAIGNILGASGADEGRRRPVDPIADGAEGVEEEEDGLFADVAADMLDCDAGVAEENAWPSDSGVAQPSDYQYEPGLYNEDAQPDLFGDEGSDDEEIADKEECLETVVAAAVVSPLGYVSVESEPWNQMRNLGRITSWPTATPLHMRSCSMRCYMHPRCGSPAKLRRVVTDQQLLDWLLSGRPMASGTDEERRRATAEHKAKWDAIFNATRLESTGVASSSAHVGT